MRGSRRLPLLVLLGATCALALSIVWVSTAGPGPRFSTGPWGVASGNGPVTNMAAAERAAGRFGQRRGLEVGEVMEFSNGYYAELIADDGSRATEVLVDPRSGAVQIELGPAMMWNTNYGMTRVRPAAGPEVSGTDAVRIADEWLRANRPGLHSADPERFPGYFTLHALRGDHIVGMLSVNEFTGAVWYHGWHGRFIQMKESSNKD